MSILYTKESGGNGTGFPKVMTKQMDNTAILSYNQVFPQKTREGSEYFITRTTTKTLNDPRFKPFDEGLSYYTDSSLVADYGNYRGIYPQSPGKSPSFKANIYGDTSRVEQAVLGKLSEKDLEFKKQ